MMATSKQEELFIAINKAMNSESDWVIRMVYTDKSGVRTRRVVSPIRFVDPDNIMALCLCRGEPRRFELARCSDVELVDANEFLMPVAIETVE